MSELSKAIFLDRDGVINEDLGYVYKIEDFHFIDGVFDACRRLHQLGYKLIIATNQSGIARGYFTEADFNTLNNWMLERFSEQNIPVTGVYFCPYHAEAEIDNYRQESPYRKPGPQMFLDAAKDHGLDLQSSILVGDKLSDLQAAQAAGIARSYFIGEADKLPEEFKDIPVYKSLYELVGLEFGG
ncbi:MAG: HAD family hydrolase [Gammaproteobacteria bacterium]|nr:HAD family hydrolase [Gammaproteobacteria bacterium]